MTAVNLSPSLLSQLQEEPEYVWVWATPDGGAWTRVRFGVAFKCISYSARGITLAARAHVGRVSISSGVRIEDGWPQNVQCPDEIPAYVPYDGFILYDDQGKEIRRWRVGGGG